MEKDRGAKIIVAIALVVAIVGLTIGYAAYSATLKITGTANVDPAKWDVHFENLSKVKLTGTAYESSKPIIKNMFVIHQNIVSNYNLQLYYI